jgi:peptidoglycan/xylan/chitin deacetylase (PgdA/CDA1 family)
MEDNDSYIDKGECSMENDLRTTLQWPSNERMAVSLSYDDGLNSQLEHAIPALNKYKFKASFYLTAGYPAVKEQLLQWRTVARQGHELGNHTVHHRCSASLPGREWVSHEQDLDQYSVTQVKEEVLEANTFLATIDGKTERTFTPPCNDVIINGKSYLPLVEPYFVAIKFHEQLASGFVKTIAPQSQKGQSLNLAELVSKEANNGTRLLNIVFHGIGGDYLTVSNEEHNALLSYLHENRKNYWVDSYINIMKYLNQNKEANN